jgi:hypothetical protein
MKRGVGKMLPHRTEKDVGLSFGQDFLCET